MNQYRAITQSMVRRRSQGALWMRRPTRPTGKLAKLLLIPCGQLWTRKPALAPSFRVISSTQLSWARRRRKRKSTSNSRAYCARKILTSSAPSMIVRQEGVSAVQSSMTSMKQVITTLRASTSDIKHLLIPSHGAKLSTRCHMPTPKRQSPKTICFPLS